MAAPTQAVRTLIRFGSETGQGWSEVWYNVTDTSSLTTAGQSAEALCKLRGQLCGLGSYIQNWTVFDATFQRLSLSRDNLLARIPSFPAVTDNPVSSQLGLATCAPLTGRRQFWCRGIPDSWVVFDPTDGEYTLVGKFKTAFQNFQKEITSGKWALKVVTPLMSSTNKQNVSNVTLLGSGNVQLTLGASGTFTGTQQPIAVGGFRKPLAFLNGTYTYPGGYLWAPAAGATPASILFRKRSASASQIATYITGAYVRAAGYSYPPITSCVYDRPGDRKVSRIFGLPRGRRSARA